MRSGTEKVSLLQSVRAPGHRGFIAPKFGVKVSAEGEPEGLTIADLAQPKLAELGLIVFEQLQHQMGGGDSQAAPQTEAGGEDPEIAAYRNRLLLWADLLEVFLDETLAELERLDAGGGLS
jgi:hypothetical protein